METEIFITCPHCSGSVGVLQNEINCAIFRHGIIIGTDAQIYPHSNKITCDKLAENKLIRGCGKPFKLVKNINDTYIAEICDYI